MAEPSSTLATPDSATAVIVARTQRRERFSLMLAGSVAAHVAVALILWSAMPRAGSGPVREVMLITLSGASGPDSGGMTSIGGRGVPEAPPPEPDRPEPPPPAPPTPPKMALPPEKPRQQAKARPEPASPPEATRTVSAPTPVQGSTPVDTGVRGPGFGLSSAGGTANNNAKVELDTTDFCCGEYLNAMSAAITRNWNQRQGARGTTTMKFTIRKDGSLTGIEVERTSGFVLLDREAERALNRTTLPPLPDRYTNPTLTVHIQFKYEP